MFTIGIYGALKLSGELLIKAYSNVYSTNYSIIRPSPYMEKDVLVIE